VSDEERPPKRPSRRRGQPTPKGTAAPRRRPRAAQGRGGELRQELIEAAGRLLAAAGNEEAVTLRGVAREVGVAAPSIYLHFADRDELLRAVLVDHFARFGAALRRAVEGQTDPAERLRAGCRAYVAFADESPGVYAVLFSGILQLDDLLGAAAHAPGGRPPGDEAVGLDTFGLLVDAVRACMEAGLMPSADPLHVALTIWTHLHGGVGLRRSMPRFPWTAPDRFVDELLRDLAGLQDDPGTGPS
jgi:AcrR family transcriptional regulator